MLDHEPPRPRGARPPPNVDVHRRARAGARRQPRVEIDEDRAHEPPALERGVPGHVRIVHGELDDLRVARRPDEIVDQDAGVVRGLDVRRLGRVERRAVDDGAVQADGLELWRFGLSGDIYNGGKAERLTKLYLNPMPSWKNVCLMPRVAAWRV